MDARVSLASRCPRSRKRRDLAGRWSLMRCKDMDEGKGAAAGGVDVSREKESVGVGEAGKDDRGKR